MKKNPPELYDEEYWMHPMMGKEAYRGRDNGNFLNCAVTARDLLERELPGCPSRRVVDVGCGIGFVVRHLRGMGIPADGIEYGTWSVEHSVCGAKWGDVTERLPEEDSSADLVICVGVLSHIPEDLIPKALSELRRISRKLLWTNIQLYWHPLQNHHLTFYQPTWWRPKFEAAGFRERRDLFAFLREHGYGNDPYQWPAIWEINELSPRPK